MSFRYPAIAIPAALAAAAAMAQPADPAFSLSGRLVQGGVATGTAPAGTAKLALDGEPVALGVDGRFLIAFDRDHGPRAELTAELGDGTMLRKTLDVAARAWPIENIDAARTPGGAATEEFLRRREGELKRIAAARSANSSSDGWRQSFAWPARGRISGRFGSQRIYRGEPAAYHSGTDIAAGAGAPVTAPADGVVVLAGPPMFSLEGNLVIVDHGMGLNSAFLHLASSNVSVGQQVRQGELIGTVGATGRATGPHLHWSLMWRRARIDPQRLVDPAAD